MAGIGAIVGTLRAGRLYLKPCKKSVFGGDFQCEVKLSKSVISPYEEIEGSVEIQTVREIQHHGLRVQLEATIDLRYDTKVDNRVSSHRKMENLLVGSSDFKEGYYIFSPVSQQILGVPGEKDADGLCSLGGGFSLSPGSHSFQFKLKMTGENLPAPFRNQYGVLQYKVTAYIRASQCYVTLADKPLRYRGHCNLNEVSDSLESLKCETGFHKSLFSSKKSITALFEVNKKGFLPGEDVIFKIKILNPKAYAVKNLAILLLRRTSYNIDGAVKNTSSVLSNFEILDAVKDEEIFWNGKVAVPGVCVPTYSGKPIYNVTYHVEFQVSVVEYPRPLKGQIEIVVGTTRDNVDAIIARKMNSLQVLQNSPHGRTQRSKSIVSSLSDGSIWSSVSQPPNYSQLSSRVPSSTSIATIPPHYDELP